MAGATITAAGMRVVKLLVGHPPRTVTELIDETGVMRTAITEQVNEMVAAGFVERTIEKCPGRGRPHYLYSATPAALVLLFANNQQLVVPAIWNAVDRIGGEKLTKKILRMVSRSLAEHYRESITATEPRNRIKQFMAILEQEGSLFDLKSKNGHLTVTKRTCPFMSMLDEERNVCAIDLKVMSSIAGCPVRLVSCRHDGAPCCEFDVDPRAVNGSGRKRTARRK
jgi:predicted ArsR family transcriptional regulator